METRSRIIRSLIALAALSSLAACAEGYQRAVNNGRGMVNSRAYDQMLAGSMDPQIHRRLTEAASPFQTRYNDLPYRPFRQWW